MDQAWDKYARKTVNPNQQQQSQRNPKENKS